MQSEIEGNAQLLRATALAELWAAELSSPQSAKAKCGFQFAFPSHKKLHSKKEKSWKLLCESLKCT